MWRLCFILPCIVLCFSDGIFKKDLWADDRWEETENKNGHKVGINRTKIITEVKLYKADFRLLQALT